MQTLFDQDGQAIYYPDFLSEIESERIFYLLLSDIKWEQEQILMFGKPLVLKRQVAFVADSNINYTYSGKTKTSQAWSEELKEIKERIELLSMQKYNACLLNYYPTGNESMGWHRDNEKSILVNSTIASVSLGTERPFQFRHETSKEKHQISLQNGSLLLMCGEIQQFWKHSLPPRKNLSGPRINLTFRLMS